MLNSQIFVRPVLLLLWTKVIFFILQKINNKKLTKHKSSRLEVFCKKVFLEISQDLQENSYARVSFHQYRCFPVNFAKFLRTPFVTEHLRQLLLKAGSKRKRNKNGIFPLHYKHNFRIRLKNTLNNKIQESRISHAWLANCFKTVLKAINLEHQTLSTTKNHPI